MNRYKITFTRAEEEVRKPVIRICESAEAALRKISGERGVFQHSQLVYDAETRGDEWAAWTCTDAEGAMRGVRITAEREALP